MKNRSEDEMAAILEEVKRLEHSDDAILDLINGLGRAIEASSNDKCLHRLELIKKRELKEMKDANEEDRKVKFIAAKGAIIDDISRFC